MGWTMHSKFEGFNFDEWMRLAKDDPEAFEKRRVERLDAVLERASDKNRRRLAGLQFRIDRIRQKSRHPLGACMKLSSMMLDHCLRELPAVAEMIESRRESGIVAQVIELDNFTPSGQ